MGVLRKKTVTVGERDFVVRPLLAEVAVEHESRPAPTNTREVAELCAIILKRTTPDITVEWLLKNGDLPEFGDVIEALAEVSSRKGAAAQGEAPAP